MFKALRHREKFAAGSNLIGWLTTILRNEYYTMLRKRREVEDVDEMFSSRLSVPEGQIHYLELLETMSNIRSLPTGQRMAVILVAALGYTCHEAADQCATKVGTIKSRLNRGRATLRHGVAHGETSRRGRWNGSPSLALTTIATDRDVRLE
jgi:RNA polymerase sigma-70 factor (ECF subfamily)